MSRTRRIAPLAAVAASALVMSGCADGPTDSSGSADAPVVVLASFYPLQYVVEQVGGDLVEVTTLTPPGAEPHDIELSPRRVREVADADVVVYLSGFQAAVDEAIAARRPEHVVDAANTPAVAEHLGDPAGTGTVEDRAHEHDEDEAHEEGEDDGAHGGHDHGAADPHFWLDPTLLGAVAADVAHALAAADPEHAERYADGAEALAESLDVLDQDFTEGLATCERDVVVVSHAAFGYLAERYGLHQVGISGLDPQAEPSPARLRQIREVVTEEDVTTVFTEVLVSPKVADTLADDLGLRTAVLDPIESQADPATDYRGVMENNLAALREALGCA